MPAAGRISVFLCFGILKDGCHDILKHGIMRVKENTQWFRRTYLFRPEVSAFHRFAVHGVNGCQFPENFVKNTKKLASDAKFIPKTI